MSTDRCPLQRFRVDVLDSIVKILKHPFDDISIVGFSKIEVHPEKVVPMRQMPQIEIVTICKIARHRST